MFDFESQENTVLSPSQRTVSQVVWDSTKMRAQLSPARMDSILTMVGSLRLGQEISIQQCQVLLGLVAAAANVISSGLLHMGPFQWWLKNKGFHPLLKPKLMVRVT